MPFILDSIAFRCFALFRLYEPIPLQYLLRGFFSDFIQCIPFIFIYGAINNRYGKFLVIILYSLLVAANAEHIFVNHGNINYHSISFIKDKQFLTGSALNIRFILLFLVSCLLLVLFQLASARVNTALTILPYHIKVRKPVLFLTAITLTSITPISVFNPIWQQQSFLEQNFFSYINIWDKNNKNSYINNSSFTDINDIKKRNSQYHLLNRYEANEGFSFLNDLEAEKNILLIFVEGLSQHQIIDNTLINLKRIGEENFSAKYFITAQRQTNRGLYATFCGKYPNLISHIAKADIVGTFGADTLCLPEILKQNGYETIFLQSAELSFMRKDLFTQKIGFKESIGNPNWINPRLRTEWGIDDLTLYDSALYKIAELNKQNKKWFMSLLTVSTHHPYNVPGAIAPQSLSNLLGTTAVYSYKDALVFADQAIDIFIKKLKENHILDNTLVIIMSDEANGTGKIKFGRSETANFNFLSNNHGPFIAIGKRIPQKSFQDQVFSQVDIPVTILDYLKIKNPHPIGGRSLFRNYNSVKKVFFGNVYESIFGYFEGTQKMVLCSLTLSCSKISLDNKAFFRNTFEYSNQFNVDSKEIAYIKNIIDINDLYFSNFKGSALFSEKNKTYHDKLIYELLRNFKVTGNKDKPLKIELKIDNSLSKSSDELILEIDIFKTGKYLSLAGSDKNEIRIHPGESNSFTKSIILEDNIDYIMDVYVQTKNYEKWKVNSINIY